MRYDNVSFDEITLRLPDGYEAYARYWPAETQRGAVLYLHGIQSHCGWYEDSARRLALAGFSVLQPDRRGSGKNRQARGHADSVQQLMDDAFANADALSARSRCEKIHLLGVSWGGKQVAAMHVREPQRTESLIMITPGFFPMVGVSKAEMFRIGMSMVANPDRLYDIPLNDPEMFTSVPERIAFLGDDAFQIHQATAGFYLASRRMDRVCAKLTESPPVPAHLMLAADERIIDNEKTRSLIRAWRKGRSVITTYERSRHTLEFDPDREQFMDDLVAWTIDPTAYLKRVAQDHA